MGRFGWAASVTALSPAGLWSRPLGEPAGGGARMLLRGSPWVKLARPLMAPALLLPATRRLAFQAIAAHPERIPPSAARQLVFGWLDGEGYDAANRAMRAHVFDPTGYPREAPVTIAWCELDRLLGPPSGAAPPRRRPLPRPPRRRPHADLGRPRAGRRTLLEGSSVAAPV